MTERALTPGPLAAAADDIRDHGYAIVQTRVERVPVKYRSAQCAEPDGCRQPATLVTLALAELVDEGPDATGFRFARAHDGEILRIPVCDVHRCEASHDLYYALTGRERPDGIRAFDVPGLHMQWT
ncbi:hypothetical protein ACFY2J_34060 [Streptomyces collinus]|uniref:hypothetical protein n=1 Tax=Streptomyces collinus TaxID=42684 RepID=UPI0036926FEA